MSIKLKFRNTKTSTVNKKTGFNFKTKKQFNNIEYSNVKTKISTITRISQMKIAAFEHDFDIKGSAVKATVIFFNPKLITKKGYVAKNKGDIDNGLKCLFDGIFENFHKLDDSIICHLDVKQMLSEDSNHHIEVKLEKIPLGDLCLNNLNSYLHIV
jgi:Holliday junction resolvase RusA-like endonuclease